MDPKWLIRHVKHHPRVVPEVVATVAAGVAAVLGLISIVGWHSHRFSLVQVAPDFAPFPYFSALGVFFCGMGLLACLSRRETVALFFGGGSATLAVLLLFPRFFKVDRGLERFLDTGYLFQALGESAAVAPNAALCLLVAALGVMLARRRAPWISGLVGLCGVLTGSVGGVAFFGYLADLPGAFLWASRPMSVQEALGFTILGFGLLALSLRIRRRAFWSLLPAQVGIGFVCATLVIWTALDAREAAKRDERARDRALRIRNELQSRMEVQLGPLLQMAARWTKDGRPSRQLWNEETEIYLRRSRSCEAIEWMWSDFTIGWASSFERNQLVEGFRLRLEESRVKALRESIAKAKPVALPAFPQSSDAQSIDLFVPLVGKGTFDGFLIGRIRLHELIETVIQDNLLASDVISLHDGAKRLFLSRYEETEQPFLSEFSIQFYGRDWVLKVWPGRKAWISDRARLPEAMLGLGLGLAALLSLLLRVTYMSRVRARQTERANRQLKKARETALVASRLKSEFVANISHEIRTPLNAVIGMSTLLLDSSLSEDQKDLATTIKFSGDALLHLINDVLDFSKIEAGKLELELVDFDLRELVGRAAEMLRLSAEKKGIKIELELVDNIPRIVKGDAGRLRQVIVNLVSNAVKFTERGKVVIFAEYRGAKGLRVRIIDTGIGIPPAARPRIFGAFSQADSSTTRKYGGTGLGLSICKRLVELMGGRIGFDSEEGKGSTFWFELPILAVENQGVATEVVEAAGVADKTHFRLLLAEDNDVNQKVALKLLEKLGYRAEVVSEGKSAVEAVLSREYDLLLMDCQMPVLDGYGATREIRKKEAEIGRHLPIIALTAHAAPSDKRKCLDSGMDDFLVKPVSLDSLEKMLDKWLGTPVLEIKVLNELMSLQPDDGGGFLAEMVQAFVESAPRELEKMRRSRDAEELALLAHSLKSASGNLGAMNVLRLCRNIEETARSKGREAGLKQLATLEAELARAHAALEAHVASVSGRKAA